ERLPPRRSRGEIRYGARRHAVRQQTLRAAQPDGVRGLLRARSPKGHAAPVDEISNVTRADSLRIGCPEKLRKNQRPQAISPRYSGSYTPLPPRSGNPTRPPSRGAADAHTPASTPPLETAPARSIAARTEQI